jgi:glycosyltransferase involved in cell wall biosynthesis
MNSMDREARGLKSIVSVTPLAVHGDSRTIKQAASFSRFGYVSAVVEGEKSQDIRGLMFRLQSIKKKGKKNVRPSVKDEGDVLIKRGDSSLRAWNRIQNACMGFLSKTFIDPLRFGLHLTLYIYRYGLLPLISIPRASLYYLHAPYQFPAIYLLSRWYHVPYIYDAHDFYPRIEEETGIPAFQKRWIQPFYLKVETQCIKHAAAVVTVSKGIAHLQQTTFGCRSIVIRNCHDSRLDRESVQGLRKYLNLNKEIFLLVTIGQAKKGQAIREALEAMLGLSEFVHLVFLGKNYDPYVELTRSMKLEERVHFLPPVHPSEVVPFIRGADASLILYYARSANYEHCLPNGLFQSIEAELPLLYPDLEDLSEIARTHVLGIPIDPKSPQSIRQAAEQLLKDPEQRTILKKNLRKIKGIFAWEEEEKILRGLVADVLNRVH